MLKVIIIEDERTAVDNLIYHLSLTNEIVTVIATLDSVEDSINWLNSNNHPDLIFMDVQLKDGLSFYIFDKVKVNAPVIFITAFDNYLIQAFKHNSIDYLLKPIDQQGLQHAIDKYKDLQKHFFNNYNQLLQHFSSQEKNTKQRIVVKKGIEFHTVPLDQAAYFFTEHKLSFLVTNENKKYIVEKTLKELEDELNPKKFYRANRKFIINIDFVKHYKPMDKIKLSVELTVPINEEIIISQESAADFRKWIANI